MVNDIAKLGCYQVTHHSIVTLLTLWCWNWFLHAAPGPNPLVAAVLAALLPAETCLQLLGVFVISDLPLK
jgi:hypothetical protein